MALAPNDIVESKAYCYYDGQIGINVRHWLVGTVGGGGLTVDQIAQDMASALGLLYTVWMPAVATFRGMTVQKIYPLPPDVAGVSTNPPSNGDETSDPLPKQIAGILSIKTAFAGRRYRGRVYLPFFAESMNDTNSTPTAAANIAMASVAAYYGTTQVFTSGPASVALTPILYHRSTPGSPTIVTMILAKDQWGTQRRRSDYGAANTPFP
jgi:hypothetical protein